MQKLIKMILVTIVLSVMISLTAFAGVWKNGDGVNKDRRWYDNGDGTYANNGWYWINEGNVAKCYYFDSDGWLLTNTTTPDGYDVNHNGEWRTDLIVETKITQTADGNSDYKGSYQLKGHEYVWIDKYYIKDGVLYLEGTYCDGIDNPDGEYEADMITFVAIKKDVVVMIDGTTKITDSGVGGSKSIKDVKAEIDNIIYWFDKTAAWVKLDGKHVTEFKGTWQSS